MINQDGHRVSCSIVTFNNADTIDNALTSVLQNKIRVTVVDNGSTDETVEIVSADFPQVKLIRSENVGFGAGHNKAIREVQGKSDYHLIMNPDIYFHGHVLQKMLEYMDDKPEIGLMMPGIFYPDHSTQYLCKLLPTPFDSIGRRFLPGSIKNLMKERLERYEMRHKGYDSIMEVPHLSGCFMLIRNEVFEKVGLFDERFFMYFEDVDFSRRIHAVYKTFYYPEVYVFHMYHKGSYKRFKHLMYHIKSAIRYFNKWGWFFDKERKKINHRIVTRRINL